MSEGQLDEVREENWRQRKTGGKDLIVDSASFQELKESPIVHRELEGEMNLGVRM